MWALEEPPTVGPRRLFEGTPVALLLVLGAGLAATMALTTAALLPAAALRIAGITAGHGALLATALAWAAPGRGRGAGAPRAAVVAAALLLVAATCATLERRGAAAYLGPPVWLAVCAWRGEAAALGLGPRVSPRAALVGALLGAFLGGHLVVSASLTLRYHTRIDRPADYLAAIAYDVGANVLATESFFRGALFNRAQRRWSFRAGLLLSTGASVLRYLVDPLLPKTIEMVVGAVFYLTLLSAANCWLFWWSGSLVPPFLGALVFFLAYRTLTTG